MCASGHLVEPPIIDLLRYAPEHRAYVAVFIPSDDVSPAEKETVAVPEDDVEGKQIAPCLDEICGLLGRDKIDRIVHGGGGNFSFHFETGDSVELASSGLTSGMVMRIYDLLQQLSNAVELAFRVAKTRQSVQEGAA